MKPLETVLADYREEASVLRRRSHAAEADLIEAICTEVEQAAEPWLRWLSEDEAVLRSDHGAAWFRRRFAAWEEEGLARVGHHGRREFRMLIVPKRADVSHVREMARRGEGRRKSA